MVTPRPLALFLVIASAGQACLPPPFDETGKLCNDDRPCGAGYACVGGRCTGDDGGPDGGVDAGPLLERETNLLSNPSFEQELADGGIRAWRFTSGRLAPVSPGRTGNRGVRLTGEPLSGAAITSDFVSGPTGFGMLFCARAFGRNEFDAGFTITVSIRERFLDGGINSSGGQTSQTLFRDAGWVAVTEEYGALGGRGVELRISSNVRADASVLVDDAELYWTPTGRCVFP